VSLRDSAYTQDGSIYLANCDFLPSFTIEVGIGRGRTSGAHVRVVSCKGCGTDKTHTQTNIIRRLERSSRPQRLKRLRANYWRHRQLDGTGSYDVDVSHQGWTTIPTASHRSAVIVNIYAGGLIEIGIIFQ
jgi:hypothetical protein